MKKILGTLWGTRKIRMGLFLVICSTMLSSCKLVQSLQTALKNFDTENVVGQELGAPTLQALQEAQAKAEAAAQAAQAAQAQAEQAATAAQTAQIQITQMMQAMQTAPAVKQRVVIDKKGRKVVVKENVARPVLPSSPAARKEVPARHVVPTVAVKPTIPTPDSKSSGGFATAAPGAESSIEAEEADAFQAADNYTSRRAGFRPAAPPVTDDKPLTLDDPKPAPVAVAPAPKRAPASVPGTTRLMEKKSGDLKAENEARFKRALTLFESKDEQEHVKLTIIEPDGTKKLREVFVQRLGMDIEQRMLARVISPADLKGAGVLVVATKERDNQWVYLPSSKQTRKVVVSEQKGVILGSELRYEDFNPAAIRRSSVELLKQERIEGKTYDIFEAVIPPGTVPYEKAWVWIDPKSEMPIQIEYFIANEKVKRIEFSDYYKVGTIWRPAKLAIKNLKTKRGTDIEISNVKVNSGLPADRLSVEALSKVW